MHIEFGDSVPSAQRARDRAAISDYASRLRSASGHPVSLETGPGNMNILIVNEDERRVIGPRLAALVPGIPESDVAALENLAPQNYCTVFAYSRGNSLTYDQAVVLIDPSLAVQDAPPDQVRLAIEEVDTEVERVVVVRDADLGALRGRAAVQGLALHEVGDGCKRRPE